MDSVLLDVNLGLQGDNTTVRKVVSAQHIQEAFDDIKAKLTFRIKQKGGGAYASRHEIYGILAEEMEEYLDEVRANDDVKGRVELLDIAVAAIWGMATLGGGYTSR